MRNLYCLLALVALTTACDPNTFVKTISLSEEGKIEKINDSIYLSQQISCIDFKFNKLYISDYRQGLYVLNANYSLDTLLATNGRGRGEVNGCGCFFIDDAQTITLLDDMNRRYVHYSQEGTFFPDKDPITSYISIHRFFSKGDTIFSAIKKDSNTIGLTKNGEIIHKICPLTTKDDIRRPALSERHLLLDDSTFFSIGVALPILQEYSLSGKLLNDYDLSSIQLMKKSFNENVNTTKPNSYFEVIQDAYYKNGYIYLLYGTPKPYTCNNIIVIEKNNNKFILVANLKLPGTTYSTFCVTENHQCIAVNRQTSAIEVYRIPTISNAK